MTVITTVFSLFLSVMQWILFPSTDNPVLYTIGASVISIISLGFLGKFLFLRRYPK